jgi:hypothetical protein
MILRWSLIAWACQTSDADLISKQFLLVLLFLEEPPIGAAVKSARNGAYLSCSTQDLAASSPAFSASSTIE